MAWVVLGTGFLPTAPVCAQGIALPAAGAINQSMGGVGTASPLDAAGALYWNSAAIGQLPNSEMEIGLGLGLPRNTVSSRLPADSFGPGLPPIDVAGEDSSESGASPIPLFAFVHRSYDSPFDFGIGLFPVGGLSINYPASITNPILTAQPPRGFGLGQIFADAQTLQLVPTVSCQVTERLAVGVAPTIMMSRLLADPLFLAPPNDANGDSLPTYGSGIGSRFHWGAGFQVGAFYATDLDWNLGFMFKSAQWFERIRINSTDELGRPVEVLLDFDYPMIVSWGTAYSGIENYLFALDLRYFDYGNTDGFSESGFRPDGAIAGLGWKSVFGLATGIQRIITDRLTARIGYSFNDNPIDDFQSQFNVASPLIVQHQLSFGATYQMADAWDATLAYSHGFENSITGPFLTTAGPVSGTSVTSRASSDLLTLGVRARF